MKSIRTSALSTLTLSILAAFGPGRADAANVLVANEGGIFTMPAVTMVRFGSGSNWIQRTVPANMAVMCHVDVFGNPGVPAPRVCESVSAATAPAPPPAPPAPPAPAPAPAPSAGTALPGDVVDSSGRVVAKAYTDMAAVMSKADGLTYRYGPDAASYGASGGTQLYGPRANSTFPEYPYTWQIGARTGNAGSYSTNQANLVYAADNPSANVGVTDFQVSGFMYNTFAQLPQLSWTIAAAPGGGMNSLNVMAYKAAGTVSGDPVAIARCGGRAGFCAQGLVAFQNGVIGTVGSNTASNDTTVKLPANKVPTAIAMTNDSEFALVTVWDTTALKGQVAVISLAGLCDGCDPYNNGKNGKRAYYDWWHEWMGVYPGLANMGNVSFMKILGYVDLVAADGTAMTAPTEIAVTTGHDQFHTIMAGGNFIGLENPLTVQANRQAFLNGGRAGTYAKGGMAVVISKSEKKAAFIDLKPLFAYVNSVYFGGDLATFNSRMASLGTADNQWPYSFVNQPQQTPTVVKVIPLADKPTAVKTTIYGNTQRAWIATLDGSLRTYNLGNYAPGGTVASPAPGQIAELPQFALNVGRNPTSLGNSKGEPDNANIEPNNEQVLVNSRGDRKVSWVRFGASSSSVVRVLQDPRMLDPIAVEDAENFANYGYVVTVADHAGKGVHNFRYGPVIFSDGGSCPRGSGGCAVIPTGATQIEYGGKMALPGKPFQVNSANVP